MHCDRSLGSSDTRSASRVGKLRPRRAGRGRINHKASPGLPHLSLSACHPFHGRRFRFRVPRSHSHGGGGISSPHETPVILPSAIIRGANRGLEQQGLLPKPTASSGNCHPGRLRFGGGWGGMRWSGEGMWGKAEVGAGPCPCRAWGQGLERPWFVAEYFPGSTVPPILVRQAPLGKQEHRQDHP